TIPRHKKKGVMIADTFDMYSPKYIWTHYDKEIKEWCEQAHFNHIEICPYPTTVIGKDYQGK
ncbi:unnamed protein product, partial [marine sediment metagenome]